MTQIYEILIAWGSGLLMGIGITGITALHLWVM